MSSTQWTGTGVALVTPFDEKGNVDFTALERLINHVIGGGVEYVVTLGTTGEPAVLSADEKREVLQFTKDKVAKRVPIMAGCGGNNTQEVIRQLSSGKYDGFDAILSVSPYYNKPSQRGIFEHYKAVAGASPAPVVLYNVPGRTGSNIEKDTVIRLANEVPNIVALKEATSCFSQFTNTCIEKPASFSVMSADDSLALPHISIGACGAISVTANAFPKEYSTMVRLALAGNYEEARKLHYLLYNFSDAIFREGSPGGIKAALEVLGICKNSVRLPLMTVSDNLYAKIKDIVTKIKS